MPDVKFPPIVEEWSFNVLLNDKGSKFSVAISFPAFEPDNDIIKRIRDSDAVAPIGIFSWFNDPHIFETGLVFLFLNFLIIFPKHLKLVILNSLADVKSSGDHAEWVDVFQAQVFSEIVEQSLFVPNKKVILYVVVHPNRLRVFDMLNSFRVEQSHPPTVSMLIYLFFAFYIFLQMAFPNA